MAYFDIRDTKNPIFQIQRILRFLDNEENGLARVKPDGIYGDNTRNAVIAFQKKYGLLQTGVVDKQSWDLLHTVDRDTRYKNQKAMPVYILPMYEDYVILPNAKDNYILVVQHMLNEIGTHYDEIDTVEITGIYDKATVEAIKHLQRRHLANDDGILDGKTYNLLVLEYERLNSRDL
ncbi:MAG: peptidoglycan-binding protein [Clostridia bacterium]|nr:peptidoglycan-binding protein [Clostridia bacterium]